MRKIIWSLGLSVYDLKISNRSGGGGNASQAKPEIARQREKALSVTQICRTL